MADVLPNIRVSEGRGQDKEEAASTTTDGSQPVRRKSSSTEGNAKDDTRSPVKLIRSPVAKLPNIPKSLSPSLERPATAIDPLSHHILKRTNTENTIPQKLRNNNGLPESPNTGLGAAGSVEGGGSGRRGIPEPGFTEMKDFKEKKKGVSFLSRFSIIGVKKKDAPDSIDDDESELGDLRTEGMNAHVFSSSIGANGYIPQHKEPPRYIKVRAHNKREREFNRMFLAQELGGSRTKPVVNKGSGSTPAAIQLTKTQSTRGAVWATEFSKDGKYLAAAGEDQVVRVWSVISTPEERQAHEHEEDISGAGGHGERLSAPVFRSKPIREFIGHTGTVLDLSWSKNNFLLSSSMDKTVRLWHVSRQECLCTFKHKDFVTAIAFHPKDDRFFLAGSLDSVLRLWSIPDKSVAFWNQLPDLITAVAFSPDGKTAMAGVFSGLCLFYETEGLKYHTQIHVRSSRGKNAKGSKITGIRTMTMPPDDPEGEVKVLITSNDSRVRLYNLRDKNLEMKFRGHENTCSQIKASFSDDTQYIICGSEDRKCFIWSTGPVESETKEKRPVEIFEAHSQMVTSAIIAPVKTRQLLGGAGDPIYDLCNPPPVTLLSRAESSVSQEKRNSDPVSVSDPEKKKPEESPAYLERSTHYDGNIIITADHAGAIKVFRQDCASQKRRNDIWETGSTFSKKLVGRNTSLRNRHSRRNSVTTASQSSLSTQLPSDRILSWRDDIQSTSTSTLPRSDRSISPGKLSFSSARGSTSSISHTTLSQPNLASTARQIPYTPTTLNSHYNAAAFDSSAPSSIPPARAGPLPPSFKRTQTSRSQQSQTSSQPPTPGFSIQSADETDKNPMKVDVTGRSYQFWNVGSWRPNFGGSTNGSKDKDTSNAVFGSGTGSGSGAGSTGNGNVNSNGNGNGMLSPDPSTHLGDDGMLGGDLIRLRLERGHSVVSKLSSENSSGDFDLESEGEVMICKRCGSRDFRAKKGGGGAGLGIRGVGTSGTKLVCGRCGLAVE